MSWDGQLSLRRMVSVSFWILSSPVSPKSEGYISSWEKSWSLCAESKERLLLELLSPKSEEWWETLRSYCDVCWLDEVPKYIISSSSSSSLDIESSLSSLSVSPGHKLSSSIFCLLISQKLARGSWRDLFPSFFELFLFSMLLGIRSLIADTSLVSTRSLGKAFSLPVLASLSSSSLPCRKDASIKIQRRRCLLGSAAEKIANCAFLSLISVLWQIPFSVDKLCLVNWGHRLFASSAVATKTIFSLVLQKYKSRRYRVSLLRFSAL